MTNKKTTASLALAGFGDIFRSTENESTADSVATSNDSANETILEIPLEQLHPPEFHPFHVVDDESMERLVRNIKQYGVREPGLARPKYDNGGGSDGSNKVELIGYELLCGNRRKRACEIVGLSTMPVIIRDMDDNSAVIAMVDSNLEQREKLLPSEKAWAYRVKLEALNHQGIKSEIPGQLSVDILCEQTGESKNQIFRLIRLTELIVALIDKVDSKQIAFNPAVELSYLTQIQQTAAAQAIEHHDIKPSLSQAKRLKKLHQAGELTLELIDNILSETKKPPKGSARFRQYFPPEYSKEQMDDVIVSLLKDWQKMREGDSKGFTKSKDTKNLKEARNYQEIERRKLRERQPSCDVYDG